MLDLGALVYVSAERLEKKYTPGGLNKISTENQQFFKKTQPFIIRNGIKATENTYFYWLSNEYDQNIINNRFARQELVAF